MYTTCSQNIFIRCLALLNHDCFYSMPQKGEYNRFENCTRKEGMGGGAQKASFYDSGQMFLIVKAMLNKKQLL